MAKRSKSADSASGEKIPDGVRAKYDAIHALIEEFCKNHLNDEYRDVCVRMLGVLARKRPTPLTNGMPPAWAAGIVRAVGQPNFLGDKSQSPYMSTAQIDKGFGVSQATGAAKSSFIRKLLKVSPLSMDWVLPSRMNSHPVAQVMSMFMGFDAVDRTPRKAKPRNYERESLEPAKLFTLEAFVTDGPMTDRFSKDNPVIARTIQIRGDQTLEELHDALFAAFGRFDAHMYEFQFGGKGPNDPKAKRYGLPEALESDDGLAGIVSETAVGSLGLKVNQAFGYWFDFGDDWWHQINVNAVDDDYPSDTYPKLTASEGANPPQYPDFDEKS